MIVEDEIRILNSLAYNIGWEEHGIEVVALAENGQQALTMLEQRMPDIMLIDIEMPELNGLALAEQVLQKQPQTKIVILSGHDDFQYAQKAIELGVSHYLLKPAGDREILQTIIAVANQLQHELLEKHNVERLQKLWKSRLPQLQSDLLRNWITNQVEGWQLQRHAAELEIDLAHENYMVVVCEMDPVAEEETRFTKADEKLLQFSLESIAKEFINANEGWVFQDIRGATVLLFCSQANETAGDVMKRVNVRITRLLDNVTQCLKLTASAGLGNVVSSTEVTQSYQQACRAIQARVLYGHAIAIPYIDMKQEKRSFHYDASFERNIEVALFTGDDQQAEQLVEQYVARALEQTNSTDVVYDNLLYLSGIYTRIIQSQGWSMQAILAEDYIYMLDLEKLVSREQMIAWAKRAASHIVHYVNEERQNTSNQMINKIIEIVNNQLAEDLSLHTIAENLFVNSSYLSRLFKRETGQSFSSYVLEHRMEYAKTMILNNAKVYDVATATGYRDLSYFAKVFRKYWGVAPSDLKRQ